MEHQKMRKWLWIAAVLACAGAQGPKGDTGDTGQVGAQGPRGDPGTNGANGNNGLNTLVAVSAEPVGANCSGGGVKVDSGLDANANASLEASEVASTSYVCNGSVPTGTVVAFAGTAV